MRLRGSVRTRSRYAVNANGGGEPNQVVPHQSFYTKGSYSAFAFTFAVAGNPAYTLGEDYNAYWTIKPGQFPNQSQLDWYVPEGTIPGGIGVWGYHHIDFANYDYTNVQTPVAPRQIANLSAFAADFTWSWTGSQYFGLLSEIWLTQDRRQGPNQGNSSVATTLAEVGVLLHTGDAAFHNGGTLIGTTHVNRGVTYTARSHPGGVPYITFLKSDGGDVLTEGFDWKAALDYLTLYRAITGSEWVNGLAFGVEPNFKAGSGTHAGRMIVTNYGVTLSGSTLSASADYLGTNLFTNGDSMTGWNNTGLSAAVGGQPDMDGGSTAVLLVETTGAAGAHEFIKSDAFFTVPTRELTLTIFEDVKAYGGRDRIGMFIASGGFSSQFKENFNLTALTHSNGALAGNPPGDMIGTEFVRISRQIIDMGNGWRRVISRFRKATGVTQIFFSFRTLDASDNDSFVGDTGKGIYLAPHHRMVADLVPVISGTPAAAPQNVAYSYIPSVRDGVTPFTFARTGTALPAGLSFNTSTGEISGTPTAVATTNGIVITVTDANGRTSSQTVSITVAGAWYDNAAFDLYSAGWSFNRNAGFLPALDGSNNPILTKTGGKYPKRAATFAEFFASGAVNSETVSGRTMQRINATKLQLTADAALPAQQAAGTIIVRGADNGGGGSVYVGYANGNKGLISKEGASGVLHNGWAYQNYYGSGSLSPGPFGAGLCYDAAGLRITMNGGVGSTNAAAAGSRAGAIYLGATDTANTTGFATDGLLISVEKFSQAQLQAAAVAGAI